MNLLRKGLPALPARMLRLEVDARGYPVPWFVQWIKGEPDFRVVSPKKFQQALRFNNCWICGERLGVRKTFVMGTLNIVNRVTSEPACHIDCARFAAMACPFMLLPKAQYRTATLPQGAHMPPNMLDRNPGCVALWTTKTFKIEPGANGTRLIVVSSPVAVDWYAMGLPATRKQVMVSIEDGLAKLWAPVQAILSERERIAQMVAFENAYARSLQYLPTAMGGMFADGF
jgi:hypothetical protein